MSDCRHPRWEFLLWLPFFWLVGGCDLIKIKKEKNDQPENQGALARVDKTYLYPKDIIGLVPNGVSKSDSAARVQTFIEAWIRKELLLQQAGREFYIDENEIQRKLMDYRYSLISYAYQNQYVQNNLSSDITENEIQKYYQQHSNHFTLQKNIIKGIYIKVSKRAPKIDNLKKWIESGKQTDIENLRKYCIHYAEAYHIENDGWIEFDKLTIKSPLANIPDKVQFLARNNFYSTTDDTYLYILKINAYKISSSEAPLDFIRDQIKNIILNSRKTELIKKLEEDIYAKAQQDKTFEIYAPNK